VSRDPESPPPKPDVEIGAAVRAKKLRFRRKPEVEVSTYSEHEIDPALADELGIEGDGDSHTERENLPEEVEPDVTYRDVRVRWVATARLDGSTDSKPSDD
jgi:hypothetical protein